MAYKPNKPKGALSKAMLTVVAAGSLFAGSTFDNNAHAGNLLDIVMKAAVGVTVSEAKGQLETVGMQGLKNMANKVNLECNTSSNSGISAELCETPSDRQHNSSQREYNSSDSSSKKYGSSQRKRTQTNATQSQISSVIDAASNIGNRQVQRAEVREEVQLTRAEMQQQLEVVACMQNDIKIMDNRDDPVVTAMCKLNGLSAFK